MKATAADLLRQLSQSEHFKQAFAHGTMSVEVYAPVGSDPQTPHIQDEIYFIHSGSGTLVIENKRHSFSAGACFFVPAGAHHRFEEFSNDFSTWVVFWGPQGGER